MSNTDIQGLFVWHELMTTDPQGAAAFYCAIFPWRTQPSGVADYQQWMSGSSAVGGLMAQPAQGGAAGAPPSWLTYLGAADVDATVQEAQLLGGGVLKPPMDIPGVGRFAVLTDPQGAAFAVFSPLPREPAAEPQARPFSWHELATTDPQGALDFYVRLFGWHLAPAHDMGAGNLYHIVEHQGAPAGGVYRLQDPSRPPHWLTYVKVDDLDRTLAATRAAGGRVVQEPMVVPDGRVARILDPQGGAIALHEAVVKAAAPAKRPDAHSRAAAPARKARRQPARRKAAVKRRPAAKRAKAKTASGAARAGTRRPAPAKAGKRRVSKAKAGVKSRAGKTRAKKKTATRAKVARKAAGRRKGKTARR